MTRLQLATHPTTARPCGAALGNRAHRVWGEVRPFAIGGGMKLGLDRSHTSIRTEDSDRFAQDRTTYSSAGSPGGGA